MTYIHKFNNLLSLIHLTYVNKRTGSNTEAPRRDREDKGECLYPRHHRCPPEQETHRRGIVCSLQCLLSKCRKEDASSESDKGTCIQERQATRRTSSIISIPSFFFSNQVVNILMTIDDFCYHTNPQLFTYLLQIAEMYRQ